MSQDYIDKLQAGAEKAMKKAVAKALREHEAAGVPAAIWKDGKVVYLKTSSRKKRRGR